MAIAGLRTTEAFNNPTGRRPENWREGLLMLYPNGSAIEQAPLVALTAVMKSESVTDPKFHWFEKRLQSRRLALAANLGASTGGTVQTVTVVSGGLGLKAGDVLMVEQTNEELYLNTTPSADGSISVIRGFNVASGAATAAVTYNGAGINPNLKVIGSAYEEGSSAPDPISFDPTEYNNQCQIFRSAYALTGTAQNVKTRTGDEVKESKRESAEYFSVDMENAYFFGQKSTTTRNGKILRKTQGLKSVIDTLAPQNAFAVPGGNITMDWLEATMIQIFRFGSSEKMAFCGLTFMQAVSQAVRKNFQGNFEITDVIKEYGMQVRRLITPAGTLVLKAHPLFTQMQGGTTGGTAYTSWDNGAFVIDMTRLKYKYVTGRDMQHQDKMAQNGDDAMLSGYIAECGLETHHAETHAYITGALKGAKDA